MKESLIVSAIQAYLSILEKQKKLVYIRNNSGALPTRTGGLVRFGKTGSPDFIIFLRDYSNISNGRCLHCEVKNEKGRLSPGQLEYKENITKLGHRYVVVRSLDELQKILKPII